MSYVRQEFVVKVLNESENELPSYAKEGDSGMDVRSKDDFEIYPGEVKIIQTGLKVRLPYDGLEIQIRPRSGMSSKTKMRIANPPGTLDSAYTGGLGVIVDNIGSDPIRFKKGERIAQIVLCPVYKIIWDQVSSEEELGQTGRGSTGFGSSGSN